MFIIRRNKISKHYTPQFKKHHVEAWRTSGLTRRQYYEAQGLSEGAFKLTPSQIIARNRSTAVLPVQIARPSTAQTLTAPDFAKNLRAHCAAYGLSPRYLKLEITERSLVDDERAKRNLQNLSEDGFFLHLMILVPVIPVFFISMTCRCRY